MTAHALRHTITTLTLAGVAAACTSTSSYDAPTSPPNVVHRKTVQALPTIAFNPSTVTIAAGDTVAFEFGSVAHNVFFEQPTGAPTNITAGTVNATVARVFATAGTYDYTCHIHPAMRGTVV